MAPVVAVVEGLPIESGDKRESEGKKSVKSDKNAEQPQREVVSQAE